MPPLEPVQDLDRGIDRLLTPAKDGDAAELREYSESSRSPALYLKALRALGPKWALERALLAYLKKSGALERRSPLRQWSDLSPDAISDVGASWQADRWLKWRLDHSPPFLFPAGLQLPKSDSESSVAIQSADRLLRGQFPFFGYVVHTSLPPNWRRNPVTNASSPETHWSQIDDSRLDDIKLWWELNRFSWAFYLARAYLRTGEERYPEAFWSLVESWMAQNPPNCGVNWVCGQEASFRAMALCFGFYAFLRSPHTTSERVCRMLALMAAHADRIDSFHEYAHSQKNNHGISEGVGLWTIGLLFPELRNSARWKKRGRRIIEREVRRQVYPDGSYIQHSTNYHRVLLQDLAWALRLAACNSENLDDNVHRSFCNAVHFLRELTDPHSGWGPNCGANDGALVLPLSDCHFPDMRPVLQACYYLAEKKRLYPPGPWDEETLLINGQVALAAAPLAVEGPAPALMADSGGYFTTGNRTSWAMLRGAEFKDRPSHSDQLHLDLWWRGENVLCDSGSFSYNAGPPFDHGFAATRYHNTVTVDGHDQMTRLSRFLWADWSRATVRRSVTGQGLQFLQGEHDGYLRFGVVHRRSIAMVDDGVWLIVDDLSGSGHHIARLHWHAPDAPCHRLGSDGADLIFGDSSMRIHVASTASIQWDVVRAGQRVAGSAAAPVDPARGWTSRFYGRKEPSLSFAFEVSSPFPVRYVTVITLGTSVNTQMDSSLRLVEVGPARFSLSGAGEPQAILQIK